MAVKSDSLGSLLSLSKNTAKASGLSLILAEISLMRAEQNMEVTTLEHVPGVANVLADALSRQDSPNPPPLPQVEQRLRALPPARDATFWVTLTPPIKGRVEKSKMTSHQTASMWLRWFVCQGLHQQGWWQRESFAVTLGHRHRQLKTPSSVGSALSPIMICTCMSCCHFYVYSSARA